MYSRLRQFNALIALAEVYKTPNIEKKYPLDTMLTVCHFCLGMDDKEMLRVFGEDGLERVKELTYAMPVNETTPRPKRKMKRFARY